MTRFFWFDLCVWLGVDAFGENHLLLDIKLDSRALVAGDVFLALPGVHQHGVAYALAAKAQGAKVLSTVLAEGVDICVPNLAQRMGDLLNWFYDAPAQAMQLVGITGTNGKTSTSHYLAQWLHALGKPVAMIGTVGNGRWGQLQAATHTTPDAPSLYRQLAQWRAEGVEVVVMEVSSHAIDQHRIAGLSFAVVALTQVSRDHLDYHGTLEHYRATKARLFTDWPSAVQVLNADDALGAALLDSNAKAISYGRIHPAAIRAEALTFVADGVALTIRTPQTVWQGKLPLYGEFNVDNVLCALACAQGLGVSLTQLWSSVSHTQAVAGRMQQVRRSPLVVVDYAHTPDALSHALQALRAHVGSNAGRLWVVFGAGGDRDVGKRPLMGRIASEGADWVVVTDDNPRSEVAADIAAAIMQALSPDKAVYIADRRLAICHAIRQAGTKDIVLVAGKGHETYQEIAGVRYDFSDSEVIRQCSI